jgi:hypothetical protein
MELIHPCYSASLEPHRSVTSICFVDVGDAFPRIVSHNFLYLSTNFAFERQLSWIVLSVGAGGATLRDAFGNPE